jgi:hypothetical protein
MSEKHWTEMTADEQVPPWSLLIDQLLLRQQLDAHNAVAEEQCVCLEDETGTDVSALCHLHGNGGGS